MVALAPNTSETSPWDVLDTFPKLHSRARETITTSCTEVAHSKSLGRVEIWLMIYEGCDGLESFTRDPIGYYSGDLDLYSFVSNSPTFFGDPSGLLRSQPQPNLGGGHSLPNIDFRNLIPDPFTGVNGTLGVSVVSQFPIPIAGFGGGIFVRCQGEIRTGGCKCCGGCEETYSTYSITSITCELGVYVGLMTPSSTVQAPIIEELECCPSSGRSITGGITVRVSAGPLSGTCRWDVPGFSRHCVGSFRFANSLGGVNLQVSGFVQHRRIVGGCDGGGQTS